MKLKQILFANNAIYNLIKRQISTKIKLRQTEEYIKTLPVFDYTNTREDRNRIYVWGSVKTGALGVKYIKQKTLIDTLRHPKRLGFGERYDVISATCGFGFTSFIVDNSDEGKIYGTGLNTDSQIGCHRKYGKTLEVIFFPQPINIPFKNPKGAKVKKISAGRAHLAVLSDEGLYLLGNNAYGQCGRPVIDNESYVNNEIVNHIPNLYGVNIKDVICGQDHTIAICENGAVYSCGWGADGQTGLGYYKSTSQFSLVQGDIKNENIVKISCRSDYVMALNDKGEAFGWGNTEYGQITTSDDAQQISTPMYLNSLRNLGRIVDIASGGSFCLVLNENRHVFVWGFGLLGVGPTVQQSTIPLQIPPNLFGSNEFNPNSHVMGIECGLSHLAVITSEGDLYTWGRNRNSCLGLGNLKDQYFPLKVAIGGKVKEVSCGFDHTVAVCEAFTAS